MFALLDALFKSTRSRVIVTVAFFVIGSVAGWVVNYRLFSWQLDAATVNIAHINVQLDKDVAKKVDVARNQEEVIHLLTLMKQDVETEGVDRRANAETVIRGLQRANERIDRILEHGGMGAGK